MFEIVIFLVAICFIMGILKAIWDALKDIILGILGIGIIVAAVVFLGPILLSIVGAFGPIVLSALPVIPVILIALFILGCIISFCEKLKYASQSRELNRIGMKKISGSLEVWKKLEKLRLVEITDSGYVISDRFYKRIIKKTNQEKIVTVDTFQDYCLQAASSFQADNTISLLNHMKSQGFLVLLQEGGLKKRYLSQRITKECEHLFELEGAATESEFSAICEASSICSEISVKPEILAKTILNHAVSQGTAHKVDLSDLDRELFVSDKSKSSSKLVRREISLD